MGPASRSFEPGGGGGFGDEFGEPAARIRTRRTRAGLAAAKRRGVKVGRKPKLTGRRLDQARKMIAAGQPVAEVAHFAQVSRATLYRAIQRVA